MKVLQIIWIWTFRYLNDVASKMPVGHPNLPSLAGEIKYMQLLRDTEINYADLYPKVRFNL